MNTRLTIVASALLSVVISLSLSNGPVHVLALDLDKDGGYHLAIGLVDGVKEFVDSTSRLSPNDYIDQIQNVLDEFSSLLWEASEQLFYIKTVQVVIPGDWIGDGSPSNKASYRNADIQIAGPISAVRPRAENYHACGKPGVRIQLPFEFFGNEGLTTYGKQQKGLLNLWLRYRFGVWEEHGYPDHNVTPYVHNEDDLIRTPWILTSCNDTEIKGEFYDRDDNICSRDNTHQISSSCRFVPYTKSRANGSTAPSAVAQEPTSSVMNFQWITSINKLCKKETHSQHAPNRQNLYCNFRSVWEVVEGSEDFARVNNSDSRDYSSKKRPEIDFHIVYETPMPLLYILLDKGDPNIQVGDELYEIWNETITSLINDLPDDIVMRLVSYPVGPESSPSLEYDLDLGPSSEIVAELDWTILNDTNREQFKEALDFREGHNNASYDFRIALVQAVEQLKLRKHSAGAILLMLRTGTGVDWTNYDGIYEEDLVLDLKVYGINLCTIEIGNSTTGPLHPNLNYLASESGGVSGFVLDSNNASQAMKGVTDFVLTKFVSANATVKTSYDIIYRETLHNIPYDKNHFIIPKRTDIELLSIRVTTKSRDVIQYMRFQLPGRYPFNERREWNHTPGGGITYTTTVNLTEAPDGSYNFWGWELYFKMNRSEGISVPGLVTVYGTLKGVKATEALATSQLVLSEIFTSAPSRYWSCEHDSGVAHPGNDEPLAIHVKLRTHGTDPMPLPVLYDPTSLFGNNTRQIYVGLLNLKTGGLLSVQLQDGGYGADLVAYDGVYSGYLLPREDGVFRLHAVFVDSSESRDAMNVVYNVTAFGTLLDVAQLDMGFTVKGVQLAAPYSSVGDGPGLLHVTANCDQKRYISRVIDVVMEQIQDTQTIRMSFRVPQLVTTTQENASVIGISSQEEFNMGVKNENGRDVNLREYYFGLIFESNNLGQMISNVEQSEILHSFVIKMLPAGREVSIYPPASNSTFFAVQLLEIGQQSSTKSGTSNIARIKGYRRLQDVETPSDEIFVWDTIAILAISGGAGFIILLLLIILCLLIKRNRQQRSELKQLLSKKEIKEFLQGGSKPKLADMTSPAASADGKKSDEHASASSAVDNEYQDTSELVQSLPYDSKYEIARSKLHIDKTELLGEGNFGQVFKGYLVGSSSAGKVLIVAVKTMKPVSTSTNQQMAAYNVQYFKTLLVEVKLMTYIGNSHPNIVGLVGACTKHIRKCEVFIATEYCEKGSLLNFLRKAHRPDFQQLGIGQTLELGISTWHLVKWAREIANGMEFLGCTKKIVHGDLAARNILLDSKLVAKIGDFGLSKQLLQYSMYADGATMDQDDDDSSSSAGTRPRLLLPWKWMSPEALRYMKFSVKSDIWAYGVTLWEIFSLGQNPYPGIRWTLDFVDKIENGLCLLQPVHSTAAIYEVMRQCWTYNAAERPGFTVLKNRLDRVLMEVSDAGQDYMDFGVTLEGPSDVDRKGEATYSSV